MFVVSGDDEPFDLHAPEEHIELLKYPDIPHAASIMIIQQRQMGDRQTEGRSENSTLLFYDLGRSILTLPMSSITVHSDTVHNDAYLKWDLIFKAP